MNAKPPFAIQLDHINKLCEAALAQPDHEVESPDRRYEYQTSRREWVEVKRPVEESRMRMDIAG